MLVLRKPRSFLPRLDTRSLLGKPLEQFGMLLHIETEVGIRLRVEARLFALHSGTIGETPGRETDRPCCLCSSLGWRVQASAHMRIRLW